MKVGDGVIIDGSKLGLNGGQLVGVLEHLLLHGFCVYLPRKVEAQMLHGHYTEGRLFDIYQHEITATIPNCEEWLGREMP